MTIQEQIDQMKVTISTLEAQGNTLIQSEIDSMKQKLVALEAQLVAEAQALADKVAAESQAIKTEVAAEVQDVKIEATSFWVKYRVELIVTALLFISHVAGKFGW